MEEYQNPYNLETAKAEPTAAELIELIQLARTHRVAQTAELNESAKDVNFLDSSEENLKKQKFYLLIRLSRPRFFKGSYVETLDIVRVSLPDALKRKGILTRTIKKLALLAHPRKIRIESVSMPDMVYFIQQGSLLWEKQNPGTSHDYTDYILVEQEEDEEAKEAEPKGGGEPRRKYSASPPDRRLWTDLVYILERNATTCCENVETALHYIKNHGFKS